MRYRAFIIAASSALLLTAGASIAQDRETLVPPENSRKASEIVADIEKRPDFRYLEEVRWNQQGYYEVTYHTSDKAKVEMEIDAVTGQPR
jgi:hypothetical protein